VKRLVIYGNDWAMKELPKDANAFWTRDQILVECRAAGFEGFQAPLDWRKDVEAAGFRFATYSRVNTATEIWDFAAKARDAEADFATLHVGWGAESDSEADQLLQAVSESSEKLGIPLWPETHRATVLQDPWRTLLLLDRFPELRLNLDISHYYCGAEAPYRGFQKNRELWRPLFEKVACFHGRISNGEAMQIPASDPYYAEHVRNFHEIWREVMQVWQMNAAEDDILPFIPELGPPSSGYALTLAHADGKRREVTDRWVEMCAMARAAEELFGQH
jgi:sugar phosphate isomerase/epimerase